MPVDFPLAISTDAIDQQSIRLPPSPDGVIQFRDCAVVVVDIVDSTGMCERLERSGQSPGAVIVEVLAKAAKMATEFGGDAVEIRGDSLCFVFKGDANTERAIRYVQTVAKEINPQTDSNEASIIRIGIWCGDVELRKLELSGQLRSLVTGYAVNKAYKCAY
jgi:class 3 adenylate cyclase